VQHIDFPSSGLADEVLLGRVDRVLGGEQEQHPFTRPERGEVEEPTKSEEKPTVIVPSVPQAKSFTNSIGMEFILIPAGEFLMGSENGLSDISRGRFCI
jgi:formylglycine-generating enzyme required for sulfatase activity